MVKCAHSTGQLSLAFADNGTTGESASTGSRRRPRRGRAARRGAVRRGAASVIFASTGSGGIVAALAALSGTGRRC